MIDNGKDAERKTFSRIIVDRSGPADPWGKTVGDIDGDGLVDLIVAGHEPTEPSWYRRILNKLQIVSYDWPRYGELVWYHNPTWEKKRVSSSFRFRTDHEVVDINGDGRNDIVSLVDEGLYWFENPSWTPRLIDSRILHDVEAADLDRDGDMDIVARNQRLFGYENSDVIYVYRQDGGGEWQRLELKTELGEGLAVADIDGDSYPDIVSNGLWFQNPGSLKSTDLWSGQQYCQSWQWPDVFIDIRDMNDDGCPDVILSPAEPAGENYRISWCESPAAQDGVWAEHVVDTEVESVIHSVRAGDLNGDGLNDIVAAKMVQGQDPDDVSVYWNTGSNGWKRESLSDQGSHSMRMLDFDNDGDLDFFGANWTGEYQSVELWENKKKTEIVSPGWRRHVIDRQLPWRSLFVFSADVDLDGSKDIVSGRYWYRNPGQLSMPWKKRSLGRHANNVAALSDIDNDGDLDVLASTWNLPRRWTLKERMLRQLGLRSWYQQGELVWSENNGRGLFTAGGLIQGARGDFLQGVAALSFKDRRGFVLSWHQSFEGLEYVSVPDKLSDQWDVDIIPGITQDEEVSAVDMDNDGDTDILQGTAWLRRDDDGGWSQFNLHETEEKPDRHRFVDLNGDGRKDVIIGYEAVSVPGKLAWYEQNARPEDLWRENLIATVVGPMSLDVADMDNDGDNDVIVGEHNLANPSAARLMWFENVSGNASEWTTHLVYKGDEHHDGALTVDIDNDGDFDIVSIGWGHDLLLLYENLTIP